jgi:hypothetical protein
MLSAQTMLRAGEARQIADFSWGSIHGKITILAIPSAWLFDGLWPEKAQGAVGEQCIRCTSRFALHVI